MRLVKLEWNEECATRNLTCNPRGVRAHDVDRPCPIGADSRPQSTTIDDCTCADISSFEMNENGTQCVLRELWDTYDKSIRAVLTFQVRRGLLASGCVVLVEVTLPVGVFAYPSSAGVH